MSAIVIPPEFEDALLKWAEAKFIERGIRLIEPAGECSDVLWMTPKQFIQSFDPPLSRSLFDNRIRSTACPFFACKQGPTGRLLKLQPSEALRAFMQRPPQPGSPL